MAFSPWTGLSCLKALRNAIRSSNLVQGPHMLLSRCQGKNYIIHIQASKSFLAKSRGCPETGLNEPKGQGSGYVVYTWGPEGLLYTYFRAQYILHNYVLAAPEPLRGSIRKSRLSNKQCPNILLCLQLMTRESCAIYQCCRQALCHPSVHLVFYCLFRSARLELLIPNLQP